MIPVALTLLAGLASAAEPLTLDQAMDRAVYRPAVDAARADARAARADSTTAWLGTVGPRIGGTLTTTSRTEEIAIDTPIGAFVQQPKDLAEAGLRASWPLVDPAGLLGRAPAASAGARAAALQVDRAEQLARLEAGEAFLDVLVVDARLDAIVQLITSLEARRAQADALVRNGLAVEADRLRLDVALADARVARVRLEAGREAAVAALAWRIGRDQPGEPDFTWARPPDPPPVAEVLDEAHGRPDLRALDEQRRGLAWSQRGTWLEALPTLAAWGQLTWTDNEALVENQWVEGGLELTWTPVAGGTRVSRARATAARRHAVEWRLDDARGGLAVQLAGARASLVGALAEVDARTLAVQQATEAERLVARRYDQGLAPLTDVLQATAARADQQAAAHIARIDATRAALQWEATVGGPGAAGRTLP